MHEPVVAAGSSGNATNSYHHPPSHHDDDELHVDVKGEELQEDKGLPVTIASAVTEISPRRLRSRARASTFSSASKTQRMDVKGGNTGGSLVMDMIRSPMGHLTWLASLEDDDFVAAKMLTELGSGVAGNASGIASNQNKHSDPPFNIGNPPVIPRRRRAQSAIEISSSSSSSLMRLSGSASSSSRRRSKGTPR